MRKDERKKLKKKNHEQRKLGAKLSSLRSILDKVARGQMAPEVAYKTISVSLLGEKKKEAIEITEKENLILMFLRKIFRSS